MLLVVLSPARIRLLHLSHSCSRFGPADVSSTCLELVLTGPIARFILCGSNLFDSDSTSVRLTYKYYCLDLDWMA